MARVYKSSDDEIIVPIGESFTIELEANPTTGYDWEFQVDHDKVEMLERDFEQPGHPQPGAGGTERLKLKAIKDGETVIRAVYKRPWESQPAEQKAFRVRIKQKN